MEKYDRLCSDLHIGNRLDYTSIHQFCAKARLEREQIKRIFYLGDIAELIFAPPDQVFNRSPHREAIRDISRTAEIVESIILTGNHDLGLEKWAYFFLPARILASPQTLDDGIYLSHGWEFDLNIRIFHKLHWWLAMNFPKIFSLINKTPWLAKEQWNQEQYGGYVDRIHSSLFQGLIKHGYELGIMGHTHSPTIWSSPKLPTLVDTGDLLDSKTYVILEPTPRICEV